MPPCIFKHVTGFFSVLVGSMWLLCIAHKIYSSGQ
nr:MAG TPA: hypothetical protein [Caudoviricetes sp.]